MKDSIHVDENGNGYLLFSFRSKITYVACQEFLAIRPPRETSNSDLMLFVQKKIDRLKPKPFKHKPPLLQRKRKWWFVLCVDPKCDKKVRKEIKRQRKIQGMEKLIGQVVIPRAAQLGPNGKMQNRMAFPGYLLINCRWCEQTFHFLKSIRHTGGLLMNPHEPTPLPDQEAAKVFLLEKVEKKKPVRLPASKRAWIVGERVRPKSGMFKDYDGEVGVVVDEKVIVIFNLLGREVPVEFHQSQLQET